MEVENMGRATAECNERRKWHELSEALQRGREKERVTGQAAFQGIWNADESPRSTTVSKKKKKTKCYEI
jgi:hypothetical protein